jgi:hypothetical protein
MINLFKATGIIFTLFGLFINLIGVTDVYRFSKRIEGNIGYFESEKWHTSKKRIDRGIKCVIIGTALQLFGVLIELISKLI